MFKYSVLPAVVALALAGSALPAPAAPTDPANIQSLMSAFPSGPDHGMPAGTAGGDGAMYPGAPDLQVAISLVTAGGAPGDFSIVTALSALAGPTVAQNEVMKLTQQYGQRRVASYVVVQNFAVNDAVKIATAAGVTFPKPMLQGSDLAKKVVTAGLLDGTYYEGYMLDHAVSNKIHMAVMDDIDAKYGTVADANYHLISNQAHYDLAQALGATTVKLAAYH
ncbi:MAG: hypothetical protein IAI50_15175 [Candidatus Eremiobacteraeota bacterium]|nr:hypothetical protein [Candidatus Eremiobacteraeota bacterium]